jgi:hypothetical protein
MELHESATAVANSAGKAIARLQPLRAFEKWFVESVAIQSTSTVKSPTFKIYKGSESPSSLVGGTFTGALNSDPQFNRPLGNGEVLLGVWENCDVGASCTMTIEGTKSGR